MQIKIDIIRNNAQAHIEEVTRAANENVAAASAEIAAKRAGASKAREAALTKHTTDRSAKAGKLAALQQAAQASAKAEQARETVERMRGDLRKLETKSESYTAALSALDQYRLELLQSLPISGLEVRDGEIFRDGVTFDRLNTAQKMDLAVDVAKLRAGKVGIICVDGIEQLDHDAYAHFKAAAVASGLQLVVTRVGDGPIAVDSVGADAVADAVESVPDAGAGREPEPDLF